MSPSPRYPGTSIRFLAILFLAFLPMTLTGQSPADLGEEDRVVYSEQSPAWLRTVGRLDVPGYKIEDGRRVHHRENCTATLLGSSAAARHILTAWHCLEYYRDLSMVITFSLPHLSSEPVVRQARRLVDGGSMAADWAILELEESVKFNPGIALTIDATIDDRDSELVMAGYSRDAGLGRSGEALTYDQNCRSLAHSRGYTLTDCRAFKGASGGPVVHYSDAGVPYLAGVISEGNGEDTSTYVPLARFRSSLKRYLP